MKGVIYFTIITFALSLIIVILDNFLKKSKTKLEKVEEMLPGINCGICGFGSCAGMSIELLKDSNQIYKCKILKDKEAILKYLKERR